MSGRKRGWSAGASEADENASASLPNRQGDDAIENEMKRLRLAYDYDGASACLWVYGDMAMCSIDCVVSLSVAGAHELWMDSGMDTVMETDEQDAAPPPRNQYAAVNALLKEFHFLRQLRKFQSERRRERASYMERHAEETATAAAAAFRQEPRG
ncbi:hypothetical protein BBJ28_00027102 [Nothophytophthora sp. Chile5]|nr:hypothetical protein BBJ28_00027102 [Nothophytophthora sp. Chile5]